MSIIDTSPKVRVYGKGPKECKIAIVGEALGSQEEKLGEPFVGRAGQLLNNILRATGIVRSECFITNVIKEKPPKNNIKTFVDISRKNVKETEGYKYYLEILKKELDECTANVIVATGGVPLYALTGLKHITKRRGSIYRSTLLEGDRKVIPTIHPSSALRNYMYTHFIAHDFSRAKEESAFPDITLPTRYLKLKPTFIEIMEFMAICSSHDCVSFDIEVSNEELSCISFAYDSQNAMSIPFTHNGRDYFPPDQEVSIMKSISYILENRNITKVAHNAVFDVTFLLRKYGIKTGPVEDTMIAQAVLVPDFPKGLDFMTSIYTKEPYYKDEGKKRLRGMASTDMEFWGYNAKDSVVLMDILPAVHSELIHIGNMNTYKHQLKLVDPLVYMSERGTRVDVKGLRKKSEEVGAELDKLKEKIVEASEGAIVNPNSTQQMMNYFYVSKGLKPYVNRTTGRPTLDKTALKRIARKGFEEARLLLDIRRLTKLKGTYLDVVLDKDGRLRCSMNPVGAADSGRFSSSKTIFGTGTNMQNLDPIMKQFLLADEGYVLYNMDLGQADNRCVAYIAPEPSMIRAFESGEDVHKMTASLIFRKPIKDITTEDGTCPIGDGRHSERFWGKKANHAFNYGQGYKRFALDNEIPENEAKFIRSAYHTAYPGVQQYWKWVEEKLRQNRTLTNPYGRKRKFMNRWGPELFKEAYSWIPQSTVADKINRDGVLFVYNNQQWFEPVELLNQIHDSIVFQIPISIGWKRHEEILMRIKKSLESDITWRIRSFSIPVEVEMGVNLKDTHKVDMNTENPHKELERIYNERLQ